MKLAKNYLWLSGAETFSKLLTFAAFAFIARIAGPEGAGHVEFAVAVFLCASLVVDLGLIPYGAREIAKEPSRTNELVSEIVAMRFGLAIAAFIGMSVVAFLCDRAPVETRLLMIYGASLFFMPFLLHWVFQGHDCMKWVGIANVIRQCTFATAIFLFLRHADQIWLVAAGELLGIVLSAAYCVRTFRRKLNGRMRWQWTVSKEAIVEGLPIGLSQIFWSIKMFGGTMILGVMVAKSSMGDVGIFGCALRILVAAHTFVWLYFYNLLPSFSRAWKDSPDALQRIVSASLHGVAWASVWIGATWYLLSHQIMVVTYGGDFAAGAPVLQAFAGVCVLAALSGHFRFSLIAAGRQTSEMVTSLIGALITVTCIPLGYHWFGLSGAGIGLLLAEAAVWLTSWWCGRSLLGLTSLGHHLIRPFAACIVTLTLIRWNPAPSGAVAVVIGMASFAVLALIIDPLLRTRARQLLFAANHKPEPLG